MSVPERLTTVVEVTGKGATDPERGTTRVDVKVPELGLKDYSTPLFVTVSDAQSMEPGNNYLANLERGGQKRDKDGSFASHYFWNWGGFGDPNQVVEPETPPLVAAAQTLGGQVVGQPVASPSAQAAQTVGQKFVDAKNESIERQTAAKAATDMYVAQLNNGVLLDWDANYRQVLDRIQNGPVPLEEAQPEPDLPRYNAEGELEQPAQEVPFN